MLIVRKSPITGVTISREIAVSREQMRDWEKGAYLIQEAMPNLSASEREFIKTGMTDEDWDTLGTDTHWKEHNG